MSWILLKSCRGALRQIPNAIIFQYQYLKYGAASDVDTQTKNRLYSGGEMEEMVLEPQLIRLAASDRSLRLRFNICASHHYVFLRRPRYYFQPWSWHWKICVLWEVSASPAEDVATKTVILSQKINLFLPLTKCFSSLNLTWPLAAAFSHVNNKNWTKQHVKLQQKETLIANIHSGNWVVCFQYMYNQISAKMHDMNKTYNIMMVITSDRFASARVSPSRQQLLWSYAPYLFGLDSDGAPLQMDVRLP